MTRVRLGLVLAAVLAATSASIACDGTADPSGPLPSTPVVQPGFIAVSATDPIGYFAQLALDPRFDGAVARLVRDEVTTDAAPPSCGPGAKDARIINESTIGAPCGAAPTVACTNALACFYVKEGWNIYKGSNALSSHLFFVFGKDGVLTPVTNRADLLARLLPIDSPAKAFLLFSVETSFRTRIVAHRAAEGGGFELQVRGGGSCSGQAVFDATYRVSPDGAISELSRSTSTEPVGACAEGRRPIGLLDCPRGGLERGLADYLAEAAFLESAAVVAFEQMAHVLRVHGAPLALVRRAEAAQRDEIRHAKTMSTLARRHGLEPRAVRLDAPADVGLEALAIENAVEGCVRETYAVVRAMWQAQHAEDPEVRVALATIAREELRHAELSWDIDGWLATKLAAPARARVEDARRRAIEELRHELHAAPHPEVMAAAGMPSVEVGLRLLDELVAQTGLAAAA
ncbi:MAG: ferritin-like domain-containing protein [Deltaproteobacteria bacterium]|nr:ferritin-like domain-containing protein [Deltaproteobacteria bacterium]